MRQIGAAIQRAAAVSAALAWLASAAAARTPTPTDGPSPTPTVPLTATPTGTPPPPLPTATAFPNPARSGQRVTLDATGSNGFAPHWSQVAGDVALTIDNADAFVASVVVPPLSQPTTATIQFRMSTFGGDTSTFVMLTMVPTDAVIVQVGGARGAPGRTATTEISLDPLGLTVTELQHEIGFAPEAPIADRGDGIPDCELGAGIDSGAFKFLPEGCAGTSTCTAMAADLFSETHPVTAPAVVYRCRVLLAWLPDDSCAHALTCAGTATAADQTPLTLACTDGTAVSAFEPQDPLVSLRVEPPAPLVGDTVRLTFSVAGEGGIPSYQLSGAVPFLSGELHHSAGAFGEVVFELHADCPGSTNLQLLINYETSGGCPGNPFPYYFRNARSPLFPLTVRDPAGPIVSGHVAVGRGCDGAAIGVTVTLEPLGRSLQSDRNGGFEFVGVPAGDYTLSVTPLCNAVGCWAPQSVHVEDDVSVNVCPGDRPSFCAGDCNNDGSVNIAELIRGVAVALGGSPASSCVAADFDANGTVQVNELITAVAAALEGCPPPIGATPTDTPLPTPPSTTPPTPPATPTSCRAVLPVVAPVTSPTDALQQTIYLCGIHYASSLVSVAGPTSDTIELYDPPQCPLQCPDSRQRCVAADVPLLPGVVNTIEVCQVPGIGCAPLPDLCVGVEIEQRAGGEAAH